MADLVTPMAIRVAATLDLAEHVADGASTADTLAARTEAHPDALGRLMRHLVSVGLFQEAASGEYCLTDLGSQLRRDHPLQLRRWLDAGSAFGKGDLSLFHFLDTIRTGEPAYPTAHGRSFWDDLNVDPELSTSFDELLATLLSPTETSAIAEGYDWGSVNHVVDVGGGDGTLLAALLQAHPHMHGTLVDLPGPAAAAEHTLAEAGVAERYDVVVGDFFDPLPAGGDAYLLSVVLHDWDDAHCETILKRCAEAAGPAGRVLLVEGLIDDSADQFVKTTMDLRMLAYFTGAERTAEHLARLGARAGLSSGTVCKLSYYRSLVELLASSPDNRRKG